MNAPVIDDQVGGHRPVILGAGVMGAGIATLALGHGLPVLLIDVEEAALDRARERIEQQLRMAEMMGALPADVTPGRLSVSTSIPAAGGGTAVIEAITESAELKAKALAEVSALVNDDTVLITNTSSIPIDELAAAIPLRAQLVGTHFMNPSYLIRTVEVIRGAWTGDGAMESVHTLLAALRRTPVVVADAPGFVTSRILHPMINTAARVVQDGTANVEAVDALMQGCLGHPTGPLRTADLIGLDNLVDSLKVLYDRTGDESCRPCDLLLELVRKGDHGRKSGRGFYEYEGDLS